MEVHNTLPQRREARGEPEEDAGHSLEGQGKNRADHRGARPIQARRAKDDVGEGQRVRTRTAVPSEPYQLTYPTQGLWRHLRRAAPRQLRQAAAARRTRPDGRSRDQSAAGERMEAKPNRAERRPALADRALADHGAAAVQAGADVHPRRDRRRARSLTHAAYRHAIPHTVPRRAVHRRLAQGGPLHERERPLSYTLPRRHERRRADRPAQRVELVS
jgi:hypothetical protein